MRNIKESLFYVKIKPCIEKYLPNYTIEENIKFESTFEFTYGNSGFRDKYETKSCDLLNALNKSGIFIGLLFIKYNYEISKKYKLLDFNSLDEKKEYFNLQSAENIKWNNVGIIITASHNPHNENGVKILDYKGRQINEEYEYYLMDLVNRHLRYLEKNKKCTIDDIVDNIIDCIAHIFEKETGLNIFDNYVFNNIKKLDDIIYKCNIHNTLKANICIGFDTRSSGLPLNNIIIESLNCLNIYKCINNMCYITTPCMHFIINFLNNIFDDNKINTNILTSNNYSIHKKKNDLEYLKKFKLKNNNLIKNLYYFKYSDNTLSGDLNKLHAVNINKEILNNNLYQDNDVHLYAYNSDKFYFDYFIYLFEDLYDYLNKTYNEVLTNNCKEEKIYVDCSNGVASLKIDNFKNIFNILNKKIIKINYINDEDSILNFNCGSEYVYSKKKVPINSPLEEINCKFCTFDGDADRILYFFLDNDKNDYNNFTNNPNVKNTLINNSFNENKNKDNNIVILDGPKIICLFLNCIIKMLSHIKINKEELISEKNIEKIDINIIQTAYVNTSFINYLNNMKKKVSEEIDIFQYININIICTKTGIKYLDNVARKSSIGIFFEPNGHGTIYADINQLNEWSTKLCINKDTSFIALKKYLLFFNQTAGDAIVDFIAIELTLSYLNLNIKQWDNFYKPYPSLYINIMCPKYILQKLKPHPQHEHYLIEPKCLQRKIDEIVNEVDSKNARCFIRPSGTENLIRIFAEAETSKKVNEILEKVKEIISQYLKENQKLSE
ncbi:phosphoacetylglucosamine mutase, putative [Plasmodium gallinaceum]|uniref:Phosphoacetylglucosamine mutase, putative n=1 Tax=Plasmodium gallinaceum TaxID=5849 RepID=A0A1J1GV09_PLAGA|nr:phosphoacetylglucosamine mutase, putative [Plasmodium gallinaceum]CRG96351.1 phosphoacetylglucosamine mutase, putative [Plasmodium gallinaceum]